MLNMMDCTTKPDDREVFYDGILYIISEDEQMTAEHDGKYSAVVKRAEDDRLLLTAPERLKIGG